MATKTHKKTNPTEEIKKNIWDCISVFMVLL
jgi:hypothetical protein